MPFGEYSNFDECVRKNKDKRDPDAYCAQVHKEATGKFPQEKSLPSSYSFLTDSIAYEEVETKDGKKSFYVTGYISTPDLDLVNDVVTKACMIDMVAQLRNKKVKLDVEHEAWRDNLNIIPVGMIEDAKLNVKGVWIRAKLNEYSPKFREVWGSLENGFLDAFSIAYKPIKFVKKLVGGVKARHLEKVDLYNIALTGNAVNDNAKILKVFTKSINDMEETQMADEDTKEESKPEAPAEEKPTEEAPKETSEETKEEEKKDEEKKKETEEEESTEEKADKKKKTKMTDEDEEEDDEKKKKNEEKSLAEMKSDIKVLKAEVKALNAELEKPQFKAILDKPTKKVEEKAMGALDLIGAGRHN